MIMQIRVDQPFTLPRSLKDFTRRNLKTLYPYFHKHIIDTDKKIFNTLNAAAIPRDRDLKELVEEMDKLLYNLPFEVFCIIHTNDIDAIMQKGFRIPARSIFNKRTLSRLAENNFDKDNLFRAENILDKYNDGYEIDFFMPYKESFIYNESPLFSDTTTMSRIFNETLPEAIHCLNSEKNACLMRCIVRYRNFCEADKNDFIIEILKHFTYSLVSGYDYPITFSSSTSANIKASRILEITKINL